MRTTIAFAAAVVLLALALAGALAVSALAGAVPGLLDGGYDETSLHTFETSGPACPGSDQKPDGVYSRPTPDGHRVSVVANVSVASNASGLDADLDEIGPGRYRLSLSRQQGDAEGGAAACSPELRYNATLNVSRPDDYTLLVTLDGELRQVLWAESGATSGAAGASKSASGGGAEAGGSDGASDAASGGAGNASAARAAPA